METFRPRWKQPRFRANAEFEVVSDPGRIRALEEALERAGRILDLCHGADDRPGMAATA